MATRTRTKAKAAPVVETDDDAFEELEDIDETEDAEEAPAPTKKRTATKSTAPAKSDSTLGSVWLAEHVAEVTGTEVDSRGIRMYLRRLARDEESSVFDRAVGEERSRYAFKGPNDPIVKAVVRMVKEGVARSERRAAKAEDETPAPRKASKKTASKAAVEEVPEEAPKRTRTRKATPAPAKAAPTTRRRRAAAAE